MRTIWIGDALGTLWNALERCGALWGRFGDALDGDALGRSGALLGRSGTLWDTWECSGMMLGVVVMMMIVFHSSIYTNSRSTAYAAVMLCDFINELNSYIHVCSSKFIMGNIDITSTNGTQQCNPPTPWGPVCGN